MCVCVGPKSPTIDNCCLIRSSKKQTTKSTQKTHTHVIRGHSCDIGRAGWRLIPCTSCSRQWGRHDWAACSTTVRTSIVTGYLHIMIQTQSYLHLFFKQLNYHSCYQVLYNLQGIYRVATTFRRVCALWANPQQFRLYSSSCSCCCYCCTLVSQGSPLKKWARPCMIILCACMSILLSHLPPP